MNSSTIRENHTDEYRSFFSKNMTVFSLPCFMNIAGDISLNNSIHVKQKLPLRIYVGLNASTAPGIHFTKFRSYSHVRDKFVSRQMPEYLPFMETYIAQLLKKFPTQKGVEISILSEVGRTVGLGLSALTLFSLFLARKWIDEPEILAKIGQDTLTPLIEINGEKNSTMQLIREHIAVIRQTNINAEIFGVITSIFDGAYPSVSFSKNLLSEHHKAEIFTFSLRDFLTEVAGNHFYSAVETSIFYGGCPLFVEKIAQTQKNKHPEISKIRALIHDTMSDHEISYNHSQLPEFLTQSGDFSHIKLGEIHNQLQTYQGMEILWHLINVHEHSHDMHSVDDFLLSMDKYAQEQMMIYGISSQMKLLYHDICGAFRHKATQPAVYPNETAIIGGCYVIMSPMTIHQDIVRGLPATLQDTHTECAMIYRSWKDGHEKSGLTLEQDINQALYHTFADRNIGICEYGNTKYVLSRSEIAAFSRGKIIFDLDANKIYCDGKPMTSAKLPSQKATIDIMKSLLESPTKSIRNKELSRSSYTNSKNEMNGKIYGPLNRLCLEFLGKPFPLELKGGIADFELILSLKKNTDIGFFHK